MGLTEWEEWKLKRVVDVTGSSGWLTVCGLFWLKDSATHTAGSDPTNDVILPAKTPATVGTLRTTGDGHSVFLNPVVPLAINGAPININADILLTTDKEGEPTTVSVGDDVLFFVLLRSVGLGVRVKDIKSEKIASFTGLEYFPYSEQARVIAQFVPHEKTIKVPNVLGAEMEFRSPGALEFKWTDGNTYSVDPILESDAASRLYLIFKDGTSNVETYAMRFLYTALPDANGQVVLDFNQAFSPACMFTQFAACALPPKQNVLPFRVEAGEKKYDGLH